MSLTLSITNPKGIVLAADSRQTYSNVKGALRIGSDTAEKILPLTSSIGVTIAGNVYIQPPTPEEPNPVSIDNHILEFSQSVKEGDKVEAVAKKLHKHLSDILQPDKQLELMRQALIVQVTQMGGKVKEATILDDKTGVTLAFTNKDGQDEFAAAEFPGGVELLLAGYDELGSLKAKQQVFRVRVPGNVEHARRDHHENQYGADWSGQRDVTTRIIKGFDPDIVRLPFMAVLEQQKYPPEKLQQELDGLQYQINWASITLHDALEFADLIIQTTAAIQRFSDGIKINPGGIPGVGGPVDVAVIDPIEGFRWYRNKKLLKLEPPTFMQQPEAQPVKKPAPPRKK